MRLHSRETKLSAKALLFFLVGGFLVGFEQGLLDVGGNEFVAAEGHGECNKVPVAL